MRIPPQILYHDTRSEGTSTHSNIEKRVTLSKLGMTQRSQTQHIAALSGDRWSTLEEYPLLQQQHLPESEYLHT